VTITIDAVSLVFGAFVGALLATTFSLALERYRHD